MERADGEPTTRAARIAGQREVLNGRRAPDSTRSVPRERPISTPEGEVMLAPNSGAISDARIEQRQRADIRGPSSNRVFIPPR